MILEEDSEICSLFSCIIRYFVEKVVEKMFNNSLEKLDIILKNR